MRNIKLFETKQIRSVWNEADNSQVGWARFCAHAGRKCNGVGTKAGPPYRSFATLVVLLVFV